MQPQDFSDSVSDALNHSANPQTPLLVQEEVEDQDPPRVNLTAVVCTAIVAVCATIILLVAHPWKNNDDNFAVLPDSSIADSVAAKPDSNKPSAKQDDKAAKEQAEREKAAKEQAAKEQEAKEQAEREQAEREQAERDKAKKQQDKVSSLPVVKTTPTGTGNIYNNIRLVDASTRLLTKAEVEQMSKEERALARNAIYARHGYQFNNPDLREFFAKQSWFKPTSVKIDSIPFTQTELDNIRLIKSYETPKK